MTKTTPTRVPSDAGAAVGAPISQDPAVQNQDSAPTHQDPAVTHGEKKPYLSTRDHAEFGGAGLFRDLTDAELAATPEGLFATPTADQLALRRY
ncbi:hypothetical protein [Caulobacter sp. Root343]|uniref:hypothetical protein n=1 Tax=Caulobacter sp. Root343 TaxID=1736520 RepID=UPI000A809D9C|nr:hypothetical protein [Caulobacter sp. Root343]